MIRWYQLGTYQCVETPSVTSNIELEDIMNADQVMMDGSMFWKRVMQEMHNNVMFNVAKKQKDVLVTRRDERPVVSIKQYSMSRLTWKDDSLVIEALGRRDLLNVNDIAMVEFFINLDIALKFKLVLAKSGLNNMIKYEIGPNLQYTLPKSTYNEHTMPTGVTFGRIITGRAHSTRASITSTIPFKW